MKRWLALALVACGGGKAARPRDAAVFSPDAGVFALPVLSPPPIHAPAGGAPAQTVLVADPSDIGTVVGEGTDVYFARDQRVFRVAITGGEVTEVAAGAASKAMAIDRDALYFAGANILRWPRAGGAPVILATPKSDAIAIAVDDARVYWLEDGTLSSVAKSGGTVNVLAHFDRAPRYEKPMPHLAVDGGYAYVAIEGDGMSYDVVRVPVGGGVVMPASHDQIDDNGDAVPDDVTLAAGGGVVAYATDYLNPADGKIRIIGSGAATTLAGPSMGTGVAVVGGRVYWSEFGDVFTRASPDTRTVRLYHEPDTVGTGFVTKLRGADAGSLFVVGAAGLLAIATDVPGPDAVNLAAINPPGAIAADADGVVAIETFGPIATQPRRVISRPAAGGEHVLEADDWTPDALAIAGPDAYWARSGALYTAPRDGSAPARTLADEDAAAIAVDDTDVYWLGPSQLKRVPRAGGTPSVVATGPGRMLALEPTMVDWIACVGDPCAHGTFHRRPKAGGPAQSAVQLTAPAGLAADADAAFISERIGTILRIAADGSMTTIAHSALPGPIARCGSDLVWADHGLATGDLEMDARAGGIAGIWRIGDRDTMPTLIVSTFDVPGLDPVALACDASTVTWLEADGTMSRAPLR